MAEEPEEKSLEKWKPALTTPQDLAAALEKAFDYRGDVTITLRSGGQLVGYVFNRNADAAEPYLDLFPTDGKEKVRVIYKDVSELYFSGQDMAAGRSWAAYMARYKARKEAEAKGQPAQT
jgi:hypothetical protein